MERSHLGVADLCERSPTANRPAGHHLRVHAAGRHPWHHAWHHGADGPPTSTSLRKIESRGISGFIGEPKRSLLYTHALT